MIVVLVNPRSRANRRNPRIASEFQALVAGVGRVVTPRSLEDLDREMAALRAKPPTLIAVHGGDGTLHRAVTALGRGFGEDPIPPLAILGGGTMNVVAASLGIKQRPMAFLTELVADARAGRTPETLRRRCIRVGEQLGFIFGNGLMANFLGEYYGTGKYGPARAAWLLLRAFASAMVRGPFVRRLFKRFEGTVRVDGSALERTNFVGLAAGTMSEVGLGFKLIHRANEDLERFGVLAIHAPPLSLLPDFWSVHAGRGVSPRRAFSSIAATLDIIPQNGGGMAYTIDGDLYRSAGAVTVSIGPPVAFVKPAGALIVANRGDTMRDQA